MAPSLLTGLKFFIVYIFCYRHAFGVREELRESVEIKRASSEKSRHILEHKIKDEREKERERDKDKIDNKPVLH